MGTTQRTVRSPCREGADNPIFHIFRKMCRLLET